jgi:hypothetical protein
MRLAACEKAGVEPRYAFLNGHDAEQFIWGANGKRRQMTKGQMAMIAAAGLSLAAKKSAGGRPSEGKSEAARAAGVSAARVSQALLVKEHAPHLVDEVIAGARTLDDAYAAAQAIKKEKDWRDDGMRMLREQDADLAQRVADEEIDLDQARRILADRRQATHAMRDSVLMGLTSGLRSLSGFEKSTALQELPAQFATDEGMEHLRQYFHGGVEEVADRLQAARRGLDAVERVWAPLPTGRGR